MYAFDFSINNMTLLALTLSVGFVVDDAIVMLENIVRHIEGGMRPFEAALKGSREIGFTIVSITFSLIAVFIPVLLMGGIVGRVFREFAVTIAIAIIAVRLRLADADADAVRARAARPSRGRREEEADVAPAGVRARLRSLAEELRMGARPGAGLQVDHADGDIRDHRRHGVALYRHPEGLLPAGRHRLHAGDHRGAGGHFVRRDVRAPAQGRRDHPPGSGGALRQLDRRRGRAQFLAQQRAHAGGAQAQARARAR